jgi:tellurite resistance protein TerC
VTVAVLVGIVVADLLILGPRRRAVTMADALIWVCVYVGLAIAFGIGLTLMTSGETGGQFFAGYVTEYSLSVDNLFVFMIIMAKFEVPTEARDKVLLIGISISLVLRAVCIVAGAAAIATFTWTFFIFGALLLYTAVKLIGGEDDESFEDYAFVRFFQRVIRSVPHYDGARVVTRVGARRAFTPLVFVIVSISLANVLFALDSIPAIFGLTQDPYVVVTANALALMGLRQLYFLVSGLLERIVYLNTGLAVILGFIGVKLTVEAFRAEHVQRLGALSLPEISTASSLLFIAATLLVTVIVSLASDRGPAAVESEES